MVLVIKACNYFCDLEKFRINGIKADIYDFGYTYDADSDNAPDYGCGNRIFERYPPTKDTLEKYNITRDEYETICDELTTALSFGRCGLCI